MPTKEEKDFIDSLCRESSLALNDTSLPKLSDEIVKDFVKFGRAVGRRKCTSFSLKTMDKLTDNIFYKKGSYYVIDVETGIISKIFEKPKNDVVNSSKNTVTHDVSFIVSNEIKYYGVLKRMKYIKEVHTRNTRLLKDFLASN